MNKILLSILTVCICLLSSCTKESFPVDEYVGRYTLAGTVYYGNDTQRTTGVMAVYPTGKDTFQCDMYFPYVNQSASFEGHIENGRMKFHPNKNLDKSSSATMTDGNSEVATITVKFDHSVGTGHEIIFITATATKD